MSHRAVTRTPSMASSSESTLFPRSPVPTMPKRTVSRRSNGTPLMLTRPAGAGGARSGCVPALTSSASAGAAAPLAARVTPARAAPLRSSRLVRSLIEPPTLAGGGSTSVRRRLGCRAATRKHGEPARDHAPNGHAGRRMDSEHRLVEALPDFEPFARGGRCGRDGFVDVGWHGLNLLPTLA